MVADLAEFLDKAGTDLVRLDEALALLEHAPGNRDALAAIARKVHALRTGCAVLPLPRMRRLTAAAEDVLSRIRDGLLPPGPGTILAMLAARDRVRAILFETRAKGAEPDGDDLTVLEGLAGLAAALSAPLSVPGAPGQLPDYVQEHVGVPAELLGQIVSLLGDLIQNKNELARLAGAGPDGLVRAAPAIRRLGRITAALQDRVMKTRTQPIRTLWAGVPPLLRDLEREFGRRLELVVRGADTELGRQMLDELRAPLVRTIRNAVEHGLEGAEARARAGKPATGRITLRARHENGCALLEIADNGRGFDPAAPPGIARAIEPMIEALGGSVSERGQPGAGASVFIRVPASLALLPVRVVECGGRAFGLPRLAVARILPIAALGGDEGDRIEWEEDVPTLRLDDRALPLLALADLLEIEGGEPPDETGQVVVLAAGGRRAALLVNRVRDAEEMVARPVPGTARAAGAATLADGTDLPLLDPAALIEACGGMAASEGAPGTEPGAGSRPEPGEPDRPHRAAAHRRVLVVEDSDAVCRGLIPGLLRAGYHARAVNSTARALSLRDAGLPFDAIVCDLRMPDASGADLLRRLREDAGPDAAWADIPVIGLDRDENRDGATDGGGTDRYPGFAEIVRDPDADRLLAALRRCLAASLPGSDAAPV